MKVKIIQEFTGYPDGTDASRAFFLVGQELDLPDEFAELIIGKGHARALTAPAEAKGKKGNE